MPTHNGNDYSYGVLEDDSGNYVQLAKGQIDDIDLRTGEEETVLDFSHLREPTIIPIKVTTKDMRMLKQAFMPYWETNNWRRMHHMKMRRSVVGKNWKRRKYHGIS